MTKDEKIEMLIEALKPFAGLAESGLYDAPGRKANDAIVFRFNDAFITKANVKDAFYVINAIE